MLTKVAKQLRAESRDDLLTRLQSDQGLLKDLIFLTRGIRANTKQYRAYRDNTGVDLDKISSDFKKGALSKLFTKDIPNDLEKLVNTIDMLVTQVDELMPTYAKDPTTLGANQVALMWYVLNCNIIIRYVTDVYTHMLMAGLSEPNVTRAEKEFINDNALNVGLTLKGMRNTKRVQGSLEELPTHIIKDDEEALSYASTFNPTGVSTNMAISAHGLFGSITLTLRTWWLIAVDKWYDLMEKRISRLRHLVAITELAQHDEYSEAKEKQIEKLSDTIEKLEHKLDDYHKPER